MNIFLAFLFGLLEGITEWLPVSSTGHILLLNEFVKFDVSKEFFDVFDVVIQLGAIMAVVLIFWKKLWPFSRKRKYFIKREKMIMWFQIAFACIPVILVKLVMKDKMKELFYNSWCIAAALIIVGAAFIIVEIWHKNKKPRIRSVRKITFGIAFLIGIFQALAAVFPGTSRSGATIIGGMLLGMSRSVAAEFTFFLGIPAMVGASLMELLDYGMKFSSTEIVLLVIGTVVSFVVSVFVIRFLMGYIKKHDFKVFGWYRIVLGVLILIYFAFQR